MEACKTFGVTLWIIPGNHEDYNQIEDPETDGAIPPKQVLGAGDGWEVALLPRGYQWEVGGKTFLAFGGAPSIDFQARTLGKNWWKEEMIRESDLLRLDGPEKIDVMITHDSPDGGTRAVQNIIDTPGHKSGWSEEALQYAREGREMMNRAVEIAKPDLVVHGHYHVSDYRFDDEQNRRYLSLNMDGMAGNLVTLDVETMEIDWEVGF